MKLTRIVLSTAALVAACFGPATARAASVDLGTAGNYAVLGLKNTVTNINNSLVTINGNEGISQGGSVTNMAPSSINGNVYEYAAGQYNGPGTLNGSLIINPSLLDQNDADALAAAAAAAALAPTFSRGTVSSPVTITGNGGLNVIAINGDIKDSLTLSGAASDIFIVNVTGTLTLGGSSVVGLGGGVTANHVLYNFVGSNKTISTHVGNTVYGTLLAPTYDFNLDGAFNGEIIGGGGTIAMLSGTVVNQASFTAVPLPPAAWTGLVTLGGIAARKLRRRA